MSDIINSINMMNKIRYDGLSDKSANELYFVENYNKKIMDTILDLRYKEFGNATWLRVYHQNLNGGTLFFNSNTALFNLDKDRYSLLGFLDGIPRADTSKYEFLLEYPEAGSSYYNRWSQTSNPVTNTGISGYTAIDIHMTGQSWGGLALCSDSTCALLDGSPAATTWFYAIASYRVWNGGISAFNDNSQQKVTLWLRIK